jgi:hypothetical protein
MKEQKYKITFIKKLLSAVKNELYILSRKNAKIKNTKGTVLYTKRDTKFLNKIAQPIMKQLLLLYSI